MQEAMLVAKYGGLHPKKKKAGELGAHKVRNPFPCRGRLHAWAHGLQRLNAHALCMQEHKFFDSADYQMKREAALKSRAEGATPPPIDEESLKPKLEPTAAQPRRLSHLDHE